MLCIKLSQDERADLELVARGSGLKMAAWVRHRAAAEAGVIRAAMIEAVAVPDDELFEEAAQ